MALQELTRQGVTFYASDRLCGVPHGFATRLGGVSGGHLSSLNLGENRGDDPEAVRENYRRVCAALGMDPGRIVYSRQVHEKTVRVATEADCRALFTPIPY